MGDLTKYFSKSEFACKCGCGFDDIDTELVRILDSIREEIKAQLVINSGCRCESHNENTKGKHTSAHLTGLAVDVRIDNSVLRKKFVELSLKHGISRIGIAKDFIHIDKDASKPQDVIWLY